MNRIRILYLLLLILLLFPLKQGECVSFNVQCEDEVYSVLEEMEAVGAIDSQIYGIKPFTEKEVLRLLTEAWTKRDLLTPYLKARLHRLLRIYKSRAEAETAYLKPVEDPYLAHFHVHKKPPENIRGRDLKRNNVDVGFESKLYLSSHLLFHSQLELANQEKRGHYTAETRFLMGYGKIGFGKLALEFGVDSVWWGQSYTGTLLTSLNPPPYEKLVKLELENPILLPWVFKYLGLFKFSLFLSKLNSKKRVVPHPWLMGLKINFKPIPSLEIGINRAVMFGGKGRSVSLSTVLFAKGENVEKPSKTEGDQKAGFDIRFRPFRHLVLYWEGGAEDRSRGILLSDWSHIIGAYAPGLMNRLNLRFEYASITSPWYHHHVYPSGYTYYGNIIGYYADKYCHTYFGEISYDINRNLRLHTAYWYEENVRSNNIVNRYEIGLSYHFDYKDLPFLLNLKYRDSHSKKEEDDRYFFIDLQLRF